MFLGRDAPESADAVCAVKTDQKRDIDAAILVFGFSTGAERDSPEYNPNRVAALTIMEDLETAVDKIIAGDHWKDFRVVTATLLDSLKECDLKLQTFGHSIARGVYAGGSVLYSVQNGYVALPFGGGLIYQWNGDDLYHLCGGMMEDFMIRDAIGAQGYRNIVPWYGTLEMGHRLILASDSFGDLSACKDIIRAEEPFADECATAILLRRQLEQTSRRPAAIIDCHM